MDTRLQLALGLISAAVAVLWLVSRVLNPRIPRRLLFRIYFGVWPEKNEHLKGLARKHYVEPRLRTFAEKLNNAYIAQTELLKDMLSGEIGYREAKKRLSRADKEVKRAESRFYRAQEVAGDLKFVNRSSSYRAYVVPPVAQQADKGESK